MSYLYCHIDYRIVGFNHVMIMLNCISFCFFHIVNLVYLFASKFLTVFYSFKRLSEKSSSMLQDCD